MVNRQLAVALCGALGLACQHGRSEATPTGPATGSTTAMMPPSASAAGAVKAATGSAKPPIESFKGLQPWKPPRPGIEPVTPPESLLRPWRAFVNQAKPRQKKNPLWQPLPPNEAVMLRFDEPSPFQCLVNPIEIVPRPNDRLDGVDAWVLIRRLRCSSDGWKTWSELPHSLIVKPDGTEERPTDLTELFLREPRAGEVIETVVLLRSDERRFRAPPLESEE